MLTLALRNIVRHRVRAALTLTAIALGVASLVLSGGFIEDLLVQLRESTIRSQLGHLQVYKQGRFASGSQGSYDFLIDKPEAIPQALRGIESIVEQTRRLGFSGLLSNGRSELPVIGEGVEPAREAKIGSSLTMLHGRNLAAENVQEIIVGEGLANALKLTLGDTVSLVVNTREGAMNTLDFMLVGVFRTLSKEFDARAVRVPLGAAQELTATSGVNAMVLLLSDTSRTERAHAEVAAALPSGLEVKSWGELADFYNNTVAFYQRQFGFLQLIIVVMVLLSVANSVNMSLHERKAEFGIIRALGRTGGHVFRLAMLESALLGAIGAAIGVAAGCALALVITAIGIPMPPPPNSESGFTGGIRIAPLVLIVAFVLGTVASIAASVLPARHLSRVPVVDALRSGV